jgi:hypothetical protein
MEIVGSQSLMEVVRFSETRETLHGPPQSTRRILLLDESNGARAQGLHRKRVTCL